MVIRLLGGFHARKADHDLGPSTKQEAIAPFHYTTPGGYQTVNGELRAASAAGESVKRYERILNASLDKRPVYDDVVWRKADLDRPEVDRQSFLEAHQEGNTVTKKAFTSTSKAKKVARHKPGRVMMVMRSKKGRDIEDISNFENEEEVLFKTGTRFRIERVEEREGLTWIYMEELAP